MIKAGATDEDLRLAREEGAFYENDRTGSKEFVIRFKCGRCGSRCKK